MTLKDYSVANQQAKPAADPLELLQGLDNDTLMRLRNAIDQKLDIDPRSLNMAEELTLQYKQGKALLESVHTDGDVPANQRAQVFNTVGTMLDKIFKQMKVAFDAERLKRYEAAFMKTLDDFPVEAKRKFLDIYSDYLNPDGTPK
jgi:hypothetical protein